MAVAAEPVALRLEPLAVAHAPCMFDVLCDPAIYEFIPERRPESLEDVRKRYRLLARGWSSDRTERWLNWIARLDTGQCAGFVQSTVHATRSADFAFVFGSAFQGKGIAHAASRLAIPLLRDAYGVHTLFATVDERNGRSLRLLARLGFEVIAAGEYPHGTVDAGDVAFQLRLAPQPPGAA